MSRCCALLLAALGPLAALHAQTNYTPATFTTLAGNASVVGGFADGTGSAARFFLPRTIAVDAAGSLYVADSVNSVIRKVSPDGVVVLFAGAPGATASVDGARLAARFSMPFGIAVDAAGTIYVADTNNQTIRRISTSGIVSTLAGLAGSIGTADGTGSAARFNYPTGVAVDAAGNVYVTDTTNDTIRKITAAGLVTTLAGSAGNAGSADGTGSSARFNAPYALTVDGAANIFVTDFANQTIRKVTPLGVVTTVAGVVGVAGSNDGPGRTAHFYYPIGIAVNTGGTLFVTDCYNHTIRQIGTDGTVTTLGGLAGSFGHDDGNGSTARFLYPEGLAVTPAGILYVADANNNTIRRAETIQGGDINAHGRPDIAWENTVTGDRGFWLMNGTTLVSWADLGLVTTDWHIAATADFNGDGQTDILWENAVTGACGFWLMNGTTFVSWVSLGMVSTDWRFVAAADFNGDGKPDILMENNVTGIRGFWLMNGTSFSAWVNLGAVSTDWHFVAAADFNGDGKADILMENTVTGDRRLWLMNGTAFASSVAIDYASTDWHIVGAADYNGDGKTDILWENRVTGDRGFRLMNGTVFSSWVYLGYFTTDLRIAN